MGDAQEIRRGRTCFFALNVHLVFVTKYRRDVLDVRAIAALRPVCGKVCADFGAQLIELDGEDDHVHPLVNYPPNVSISKLVNSLKGVSSRILRRDRRDLRQRYWKGVLWSPSYFAASCGGAPLAKVKHYIQQQRA